MGGDEEHCGTFDIGKEPLRCWATHSSVRKEGSHDIVHWDSDEEEGGGHEKTWAQKHVAWQTATPCVRKDDAQKCSQPNADGNARRPNGGVGNEGGIGCRHIGFDRFVRVALITPCTGTFSI